MAGQVDPHALGEVKIFVRILNQFSLLDEEVMFPVLLREE